MSITVRLFPGLSALKLFSEKDSRSLHQFKLRVRACRSRFTARHRYDASGNIALRDNRRGTADITSLRVGGDRQLFPALAVLVHASAVGQLSDVVGYPPFGKALLRKSRNGNYRVPVAYRDAQPADAVQRLGILERKITELPYRGVFLENDLAFAVGEDFEGVALAYPHGSSYFFGDDYTAEVVPLCQVGAKKFYKLSEKPLISMALGFPDGATMHLRGFDRLCYFRSKFDRFAPKGNIGVNSQLRCFHRCRFSIR